MWEVTMNFIENEAAYGMIYKLARPTNNKYKEYNEALKGLRISS